MADTHTHSQKEKEEERKKEVEAADVAVARTQNRLDNAIKQVADMQVSLSFSLSLSLSHSLSLFLTLSLSFSRSLSHAHSYTLLSLTLFTLLSLPPPLHNMPVYLILFLSPSLLSSQTTLHQLEPALQACVMKTDSLKQTLQNLRKTNELLPEAAENIKKLQMIGEMIGAHTRTYTHTHILINTHVRIHSSIHTFSLSFFHAHTIDISLL